MKGPAQALTVGSHGKLAQGSAREELEKLEHLAMEDQEVGIWLSDKTIFWL